MRPRAVTAGVEMFPTLTPTLAPATHTNSYALGDRDVLLVEPATPHEDEQRAWLAWARGFEGAGRRVVAVALTHHHSDHVGGAALFAEELGVWENGKAMNDAKGALVPIGAGSHKLSLYASDSGYFTKEHHFIVIAERPDHSLVKSNLFTF